MKKALTISALCFIAAIVITTIVLGFVNTNFAQFSVEQSVSVEVWKNNKNQLFYKDTNTDEFNEIVNLYNKESKISILTALFTGAYSVDANIENENTSMTNKITSGYWLVFKYDEAQTLKLDGENYKDKTSTSTDPIKFTKIYLQVTNTEGMSLVNAYVCDSTTTTTAKYTMSIYANQTALYNHITNLEIA